VQLLEKERLQKDREPVDAATDEPEGVVPGALMENLVNPAWLRNYRRHGEQVWEKWKERSLDSYGEYRWAFINKMAAMELGHIGGDSINSEVSGGSMKRDEWRRFREEERRKMAIYGDMGAPVNRRTPPDQLRQVRDNMRQRWDKRRPASGDNNRGRWNEVRQFRQFVKRENLGSGISNAIRRGEVVRTLVPSQTIELDCKPGNPRPGNLIGYVTQGTGLPQSEPVSTFFGCWKWDYSNIPAGDWKAVNPIIEKRIKELYESGKIRYGSW
jgi:hypothetical protein